MTSNVRVRFAPSPTGEPHLGNIRTALFNWLFARNHGGTFIVRVEDTDQARKVEGATDSIFAALRWLGIDWDEGPEVGGDFGPYYQSERLDTYHTHTQRLIEQGDAYYCYCTPDRLDVMRKEQQARKEPPKYDRHCRDLTPEQLEAWRVELGTGDRQPVVRFKMPLEGISTIDDVIRGAVTFDLSLLDDFVILKSDGYPTYHLANVVDDHLMEISHVMRAEEWLSSAPRHKELYRALGYDMPKLAHLPIILGPDKSKLSKRHGATSVLEYRDNGYLPEAMTNFLVLLGWSLDDHTEMFDRESLIRSFDLERVSASPAVFNKDKLDWFNGVYMRTLAMDDLTEKVLPFLEEALPEEVARPLGHDYISRIMPLVYERLKTLSDAPELMTFFFLEKLRFNPLDMIQKGMDRFVAQEALEKIVERLELVESWDEATLEGTLRPLAEELELTTGQLFGPIRVAITGRKAAPPLFETMAVLGKERCMARLRAALKFLKMVPIAC
jgi:glutamyl-tRNA synthetase